MLAAEGGSLRAPWCWFFADHLLEAAHVELPIGYLESSEDSPLALLSLAVSGLRDPVRAQPISFLFV